MREYLGERNWTKAPVAYMHAYTQSFKSTFEREKVELLVKTMVPTLENMYILITKFIINLAKTFSETRDICMLNSYTVFSNMVYCTNA